MTQISLKQFHLANPAKVDLPDESIFNLPEKVLQFGTGVLLRGLPDYFIDKANKKGIFKGRIVVVKSTDSGDSAAFDLQDNLYTICERGISDGESFENNILSSSISRVLSAKTQWNDILACAGNPEMEIILSNTTEVGIQLVKDDIHDTPPVSFPGKLLAFLYARFKAFGGDKEKGMIIVPTELITDNGKKLEAIVLELAHLNALETDFIDWLETSNTFCNSLVDRIVPGKPDSHSRAKIEEELGYQDDLLTVSEIYRLWAIEGDERVKNKLSFHQIDENLIIEPNIDLYRELKLRLLNGTHTLSCGLAFLAGFSNVKEAMEDDIMNGFISNLMLADLAPAIPYKVNEKIAQRFGMQVLDRFRNPSLDHRWINITVQYSSKMKMRNIPTLINYYQTLKCVPEYISFGFAAYLLFMKSVKVEGSAYFGFANGEYYQIQDEKAAYFYEKWQKSKPEELVGSVLSDKNLWDADLTELPDFARTISEYLNIMTGKGVKESLKCFLRKEVWEF
ncbi:tagaturonate reductase [Pseudarcicella hirudinis]|uniref:Tagaturonate reductase n=1 Tax=Pseudarcicella hirudinis TaxID=1079859 RepID=A0A1I5XXN3_9BACT|nr:tagaturonate reductase [Pseudarcicella hirudinis]SFQ36674.1 tagaturonate reductase [Pseudarcicella hirudinis]